MSLTVCGSHHIVCVFVFHQHCSVVDAETWHDYRRCSCCYELTELSCDVFTCCWLWSLCDGCHCSIMEWRRWASTLYCLECLVLSAVSLRWSGHVLLASPSSVLSQWVRK